MKCSGAIKILNLSDYALLGAVAGALATMYSAIDHASIDPEWLYLILGTSVGLVTGIVELWRQRGIESKISDLESKILDLTVEVRYLGKLVDDMSSSGDGSDGSEDDGDEKQ